MTKEKIKLMRLEQQQHQSAVNSAEAKIKEIENCIEDAVASAMGVDPDSITLGHHQCEGSPSSQCVYKDDDPCQDFCLFCDAPNERK